MDVLVDVVVAVTGGLEEDIDEAQVEGRGGQGRGDGGRWVSGEAAPAVSGGAADRSVVGARRGVDDSERAVDSAVVTAAERWSGWTLAALGVFPLSPAKGKVPANSPLPLPAMQPSPRSPPPQCPMSCHPSRQQSRYTAGCTALHGYLLT